MQYIQSCFSEHNTDRTLAMFMIDLDNFKSINDKYGHPCGYHVLSSTASALRLIFREYDGVGRIGGDEFAAILSNIKSVSVIEEKAERLMQEISKIRWEDKEIEVCCSIGIIVVDKSQTSYDELYKDADIALYRAKQQGKNQYHIISKSTLC